MADERVYPPLANSRVPHVATYRRALPVSLERVYENALDWERLPHVHAGHFAAIECDAAGPWGWRARAVDTRGAALTLELRLDRACRRWLMRTLAPANAGSELWAHAVPLGPRRTDVVVDCFVADVEPADRARVGAAFGRCLKTAYDADVAMMVERQRQIERRIETQRDGATLALGALDALVLPLAFEFDGRDYVVARGRAGLVAHVARCPHLLGPLEPAIDGVVRCPWHGYRFDAASGACLTGQPYRLPPSPRVSVREGGIVWVER